MNIESNSLRITCARLLRNVMSRIPGEYSIEKALWITVQFMAFLASAFTVYSTTVDYRNAPAATHMVTDMYPVKEIDFPAVAICNMNLISKRKIMELAEEILQMDSVRAMNVTKSKFLELLKTMGHLYTFSSDEEEPGDLLLLHEIMVNAFSGARRKNVGMVSKMIVVECDNYAVRCQWGGVIRMCSDILEPRFTSDGQCCAFNYARWKDHFSSSLSDKMSAPVLKSEVAGSDYGLWLLLDVNSEDYFYQLLPMIGFKVMIYSPTDYPDSPSGSSREILVARSTETLINIGASIFDTTDDAHSMDPVHRSCRFKTELEAQFGGRYSFSDCIVDCRVRDIIKKCNCIPFFYPHPSGYGDVPLCTHANLKCLNHHRNQWLAMAPIFESHRHEEHSKHSDHSDHSEHSHSHAEHLHCECYPTCDSIDYTVSTSFGQIADTVLIWDTIENLMNTTADHAVVNVFFGPHVATKFEHGVQTYCLFLGFSIISAVEVVYEIFKSIFDKKKNERSSVEVEPVNNEEMFINKDTVSENPQIYWQEVSGWKSPIGKAELSFQS